MRHSTRKATNKYFNNLNGTHSLVISSSNRRMTFLIDSEDVLRCKALHWQIYEQGKVKKRYYARCILQVKPHLDIRLHNFVLSFPDSECIDRLNRDTFDNRKSNLKPSTIGENSRNRSKCKRKYLNLPLGVHKTQSGRFKAVIGTSGKTVHLGVYNTPDEAHLAYLKRKENLS